MHRAARFRLAVLLAALTTALTPLAAPSVAHAGGFEFSVTGTTGLGRGGAVAARADDGMALLYNPAMLADLPGAGDLMLNAGLAVWDACVTRTGTYGSAGVLTPTDTIFADASGDAGWITDRFPTVCNSADPQIIPNLVGTIRLLPEVRLALGLIAPNGVGQARFGSPTATAVSADGSLVPSPTRYLMAERNLLQFFPSIGVGVRLADWIRVGLTLQWGVAIVDFTNYTNTGLNTSAMLPEDPSNDIRTRLNVVDPFIPAGILSVHIVPHRNLDVMFSGRLSDAVGGVMPADGSLTLTTSAYGTGMPGGLAPTVTTIPGVTLTSGQPFNFTLGFRYADRTRPRGYEHGPLGDLLPQVDDPLFGETFDIELDISYMHLSQVTDFVVRNPPMAGVDVGGTRVPVPSVLPIVHGWSDALAFRLGSDWNIVPGTFAARAGVSYEQPLSYDFVRYAQNDFMQGFQVGLHAGATLRLDHFDISIAYAHVFGETIDTRGSGNYRYVAAGTRGDMAGAGCPAGAAYDPARPISSTGCYPIGFAEVVNNGTYTQEYNAVSLGLSYHFE